jgi:hypothetical protein
VSANYLYGIDIKAYEIRTSLSLFTWSVFSSPIPKFISKQRLACKIILDSLSWAMLTTPTKSPTRKARPGHEIFLEYHPKDPEVSKRHLAWVLRTPRLHDEAVFNDNLREDFPRIGRSYELRGGRLRLIHDPTLGMTFIPTSRAQRAMRGEAVMPVYFARNRFLGDRGWMRMRKVVK